MTDTGTLDAQTGRCHGSKSVSQATLDEIIARVVEVARPKKVVLFGSAATGTMGPDSDVDLLIIAETNDERTLTKEIYERLFGAGAAVDAIVVTPQAVERYRESPYLVIKAALDTGKVVYAV